MSSLATRSDVAHLLRRAGFGAHADDVDELAAGGYEAAVEVLCDLAAPDAAADAIVAPTFDSDSYLDAQLGDEDARRAARQRARQERLTTATWWLQRMAVAERPLREKLTLLWHDHFATSLQKVKLAELMHLQRQTLYDLGPGSFVELAKAIVRDPAMLIWLDGRESTAAAPNENFAREFFELFTLGHGGGGHGDDHKDHGTGELAKEHGTGGQPYTEEDVAEAARAFTGWRLRRGRKVASFDERRHDAGAKSILGKQGSFGADDVVDLATNHPACAPHVVSRLWSRLARPGGPADPVVIELAESFADGYDVSALLRGIFTHPEFLAAETRVALVKTPIEYLVGTSRALRVPLDATYLRPLAALGQVPLFPPDVAGWPANEAWLSTSASLTRLELARKLAAAADLTTVIALPPSRRVGAVARLLGVDAWGDLTQDALDDVADDERLLVTLALVTPEYLLG